MYKVHNVEKGTVYDREFFTLESNGFHVVTENVDSYWRKATTEEAENMTVYRDEEGLFLVDRNKTRK